MSKIMENMIKEMIVEGNREIAIRMIKDGTLPFEKIAKYLGFTLEEIMKFALEEVE